MKFEDFQKHEFCRSYSFVPGRKGTLRPAGHRLCGNCVAEKEGHAVCLKIGLEALKHPTLATHLVQIVDDFAGLLLGEKPENSTLRETLLSGGSLAAGGRNLLVSHQDDGWVKLSLKSKSRFWPFGRK